MLRQLPLHQTPTRPRSTGSRYPAMLKHHLDQADVPRRPLSFEWPSRMESNKQHLLDSALGADAEKAAWRTFWLTHIRIGFGIFLGETLVVAGYLALTPNGPHRGILWAVVVAWLVLALVGMSVAPFVASKPWCGTYSVTWTALSAFGVAIVAMLDSGMNSPLLVLLFLPLIFGTLMFTPLAAGICGVSAVASLGLVAVVDRNIASAPGRSFLLFSRWRAHRHSPSPRRSIGPGSNSTKRSSRPPWPTWLRSTSSPAVRSAGSCVNGWKRRSRGPSVVGVR